MRLRAELSGDSDIVATRHAEHRTLSLTVATAPAAAPILELTIDVQGTVALTVHGADRTHRRRIVGHIQTDSDGRTHIGPL